MVIYEVDVGSKMKQQINELIVPELDCGAYVDPEDALRQRVISHFFHDPENILFEIGIVTITRQADTTCQIFEEARVAASRC